jgi:succinyl-CoA synthetase beta subunit
MDIHEYQAKEILRENGIPVPPGEIAKNSDQAVAIAKNYEFTVVVKAQVHSGGRGKAGGVKLAKTQDDVRKAADDILGMSISGHKVNEVLVTPAEDIDTEAYLGILIDRETQSPVIVVCAEGGIDIEEVAVNNPNSIHKLSIDPRYGLFRHQAYGLARILYQEKGLVKQAVSIIEQLYQAFISSGASMVEINPLISTPTGDVKAIDAKMSIDDSELFKHPKLQSYRDVQAEPWAETMAREAGLSYVKLDGNVGCCVNGAGLAMATMDLVKYYGGDPANFLDIGGSSNPQKVVAALKIITSDPNVEVILFNIFGGITRCDDVAKGIVDALKEIEIKSPIIIRLTGTNEAEGLEILSSAGLSAFTSMDDVVEQAVSETTK